MKKIIYILIFVYTLLFSYISYLKFNSYNYADFDLAVHSQVLWNILHGSVNSSILGIGFLGNHMHVILFLIAPIYKVFIHPLTLLFLQSFALGAAAYPLYLITKEELGELWALNVCIIYLLYPALGYTNLYEFHPTVFSVTFLLFMFYQFRKENFSKFLFFMFLSLLCQENISLAVVMFGFYAAIKKRKFKWIITPVLIGILYFYLSTMIIMPLFNKNKIQFFSLYSYMGDSFFKIIGFIFLHPLKILKIIFTEQKIIYLLQVFGPLCFLPFFSPATLLMCIPFLLQHLLSKRVTEISIYYHYLAEIIPFLFISFIYGVKRLFGFSFIKKHQLILVAIVLSVTICFSVYAGPQVGIFLNRYSLKKDELDIQKDRFINYIPADSPVVSTFEFLPHLANRKYLYSFHHIYKGTYTLSSQKYKIPENLEYALIDFNDLLTFEFFYNFGGKSENIREFLSEGKWGVRETIDTIVLFKKNESDRYKLYEQLPKEPKVKNKVSVRIAEDIKFIGYDFNYNPVGDIINLIFCWQSVNRTQRDINIYFDLLDQNNKLVFRLFRPVCYRIFPTNAWQENDFIREYGSLIFPEVLPKGKYILKLGFYDRMLNSRLQGTSDSKDILDGEGRVFLGSITK